MEEYMRRKAPKRRMPWDEVVNLITREVTEHAVVMKACRYLREHYSEKVPLGELARLIGMKENAMIRAFDSKVGMPPHEYQLCVRIQKAMGMIAEGMGYAAVAATVGFVDHSHLNLHFRRRAGMTVRQYAMSLQKQ